MFLSAIDLASNIGLMVYDIMQVLVIGSTARKDMDIALFLSIFSFMD
jgi:hypothetical protein